MFSPKNLKMGRTKNGQSNGTKEGKKKVWRVLKEAFEQSLVEPPERYLQDRYGTRSRVSYEFNTIMKTHQVYVKVISATGLLALDTNNLSDPYAVVSLGSASHSTRVIRKTLNPVWDETVVFDSQTVIKAAEDGKGFVYVRLYDWDHFSKDDFLGCAILSYQCLESLFMINSEFSNKRRLVRLPLSGMKKGVEEEHGEVQMRVWLSPETTQGIHFAPQVGLLGAPRHLHGHGGCMIEEPFIVCICLSILEIHGADDPLKSRGKNLLRSFSAASSDDTLHEQMSEFQDKLREKQMNDLFGLEYDLCEDENVSMSGEKAGTTCHADEGDIGSFAYCRATMGTVTKTTHLVRQQGSRVPINDLIPLLSHVPVADHQVQLVVYRTHKSKDKGRATHIAVFSMHDILPQEAEDPCVDLKNISKVIHLSLKPISSKYQEAKVLIRVTLTDMDFRRRTSKIPIIMTKPMDFALLGLTADPRNMALPHSKTIELNEDDIYELGRKDDNHYQEYVEHRQKLEELQGRATQFFKGAMERQVEKVNKVIGRSHDEAKQVFNDALRHSLELSYDLPWDSSEQLFMPPTCGLLRLRLFDLFSDALPSSSSHIFCVLKFENSWFRSKDMHAETSGKISLENICIVFPIHSPGSLVSICCLTKTRKKDSKEMSKGSFRVLGKLRFRISSCATDESVKVSLPFLSQRVDGGKVVGHISLEVFQTFTSQKSRLVAQFAPEYPQENYVYQTVPLMPSLQQERRDLLQNWMLSCNPPFPLEAVQALENVDCMTFTMSRLRSNLRRIKIAVKTIGQIKIYYDLLASWKYPWLSRLAMCWAFFTAYHPLPVIVCTCLYLAYMCYKSRPEDVGIPKEMEQDAVGISEIDKTEEQELYTGIKLEVESANPVAKLKKKLESVTVILLMVQNYMDGIASFLERWIALLTWKDPMATTVVVCVLAAVSALLILLGIRFLIGVLLCFLLRPPRMRSPWTPGPISMFLKLPTRGERLA